MAVYENNIANIYLRHISAGCCAIGFLLPGYFKWPEKKVEVMLNTLAMKEASNQVIDSLSYIEEIFICNKDSADISKVKWANAYIYVQAYYRFESRVTDTVLLLDIRTVKSDYLDREIDHYYWHAEKRLSKCKVMVPASWTNKLRNYKYKYCKVDLMVED